MQILQDKKIVLGISGGIAAYKTPELVRRLKDQGADIRVVMTEGGQRHLLRHSLYRQCLAITLQTACLIHKQN